MAHQILILNPWGVDYLDDATTEAVAPHVAADTDIRCESLGEDAPPVPWPGHDVAGAMIRKVAQAAGQGTEAVVIGCTADPFVAEVREASPVPVIALTETVCADAKQWGRLGVLSRRLPDAYFALIPTQGNFASLERRLSSYAMKAEDYSLRAVDVPAHPDPEALNAMTRADPAGLREVMIEAMTAALLDQGVTQGRGAVAADGVRALYFNCAFWSQSMAALGDSMPDFGVPVLDPVVSGVTYAEHLLASRS